MAHSPGPWVCGPQYGRLTSIYEAPTDGLVAEVGNPQDARRIVAAINACEGIPTEALEKGIIQHVMDALLETDHVAKERGDYGLCDSIDGVGKPYPSQWLHDLLSEIATITKVRGKSV